MSRTLQKDLVKKDWGKEIWARAIQFLNGKFSETNEGKCMFAEDVFKALERVTLDYVTEANDRKKYFEDLKKPQEACIEKKL